ncbi:hypothetical protein QBC37DRAFT_180183 [Rhypophila decipiens]|uniref:Uncharacterized protein n=1 Tax=Rhypophila decipiens TaxID=261697 RepID=A0AAN6YI40_9PEZI|nr:hypothetical protein QBC37DRAFT_180183 [Rhypophila decipiens]
MDPGYEIQQDKNKPDIRKDLTRLKAKGSVLFASNNTLSCLLLPASPTDSSWLDESEQTCVENEKENDNICEKKCKSIDANESNNKYEPIERQYEGEVQGEDEREDESGEESADEDDCEEYAKDLSAYSQKFTNTNITEPEPENAPFQPIKGSVENPKPSQDEVNDVTIPAGYLGRQIGIATIRMELMSLTRLSRVSNSDSESGQDYQDEMRPEEGDKYGHTTQNDNPESGHDQPGGDGGYDVSEPGGRENDVPDTLPGAEQNRNKRLPGDDGGGGSSGNSPSKRRRITPKILQRFACPYQAYEPFQDCLQRGPRNPQGGCDGIYRLKQHLCRRHMLSFRCHMCWRSFDTKKRQIEHRTEGGCRQKTQPEGDRFMDITHEAAIDEQCGNTTLGEEDIWWKLFRILIPGMSALDEDAWMRARSSYYPYYIAGDLSLTIPSLNFTDFTLPDYPSNIDIHTYGQYNVNTFEPPSQSFLPGFSSPSSGKVNHNSILMSQILSVPVFENPGDSRSDAHTINPEAAPRNPCVYGVPPRRRSKVGLGPVTIQPVK